MFKKIVIFVLSLSICFCSQFEQVPSVRRRFEYKYSFKPPFVAQKNGLVPFFEHGGNAIASEENVRVTMSMRSQKGHIWAKNPINFDWWEVELIFRVTGRGRIGADGIAFWYTDQKLAEGPVFGSADRWNGLGLFFDSFDNDNKHNNPYIMAMGNDGTLFYDHKNDGATQQLGGCLRDYRNKPFPVKAKIEYYNNILTVMFHGGMSNNDKDYELCLRVENVYFPKNGYFGISAATGGLADDHDILSLLTHSLHQSTSSGSNIDLKEEKRLTHEFEEYQEKVKAEKARWVEEHPNEVLPGIDESDPWFSDSDKELQQIFQGQSAIRDILTDVNRKMDEQIGRHERSLSMLSSIQSMVGGFGGNMPQGNAPHISGSAGSVRPEDISSMLNHQIDVLNNVRDIKNFVVDINSKSAQLLQRGSAQPISGGQVDTMLQEIRDSLIVLRGEVSKGASRSCPSSSGCLTMASCIFLMFIQFAMFVLFFWYRDGKEAKSKKFY